MRIAVNSEITYDIYHVVCDFNGTIAIDGEILPGVRNRLTALKQIGIDTYVITADTHGTAAKKLMGYDCILEIIGEEKQDIAKQNFVRRLGAHQVCAIGNGVNDRLMLTDAALGLSVRQAEGAAAEAENAAIARFNLIDDALDFILKPLRAKATLRV